MSTQNKLRLLAETLLADGLIRTAAWEYIEPLYNKRVKFQIPNYAVPISVSHLIHGLDIRLQIDHLLSPHTKLYLMKLFDIEPIMFRLSKIKQSTLDDSLPDEIFQKFFLGNVMILDQVSESLYFTKNLRKYSKSSFIPAEIKPLAEELVAKREKLNTTKYHDYSERKIEELWQTILKNDKSLNAFLARIHERAVALYGDIILPFTKLITTMHDLEDVKRINDVWMALNRVEEKPTVAYLLLSQSVLRKETLVAEIIDYIKKVKTDILVIKVKNLHLTDGSMHARQREQMRDIMGTIAKKKKQNKELLTIALECGEQLYPMALQAFDVVSTSTNMFDFEKGPGGTAEMGYGKALDEETLALTDYEEWEKAFNRHGFFPCSHDICRARIVTMDKEQYTNRAWWTDSRIHNIQTIDGWFQMIAASVGDQTADLAVERLRNSPIRILTELLIRNYEDPTEEI